MTLVFHRLALDELNQSALWYAQRSETAARRFGDAINQAGERVLREPQAFPFISDNCQRVLLRKFPYALVFRRTADNILVIAVAHAKRKEDYWRSRAQLLH